jgi:Fe-S-cluster containining protein
VLQEDTPALALAAALDQGSQVFDGVLKRRQTSAAVAGYSVPCAKGCAACCHHPVQVSRMEVWHLFGIVRTWPLAKQAALRLRLQSALRRAGEHKLRLAEALDSPREPARYIAAGVPCPLLEDRVCTVYEARPVSCRGRIVVNTDPAECAKPRSTVRYLVTKDALPLWLETVVERLRWVTGRGLPARAMEDSLLLTALREGWVLVEQPDITLEEWLEESP